jgi:hypothetical protein
VAGFEAVVKTAKASTTASVPTTDGVNGIRGDITRRDFTDDNGGEVDTYGVSYVRRRF